MAPFIFQNLSPGRKLLAWLTAINVAVFLCCAVSAYLSTRGYTGVSLLSLFALPSGIHSLLHAPWTPLTYMMTHIDIFHILFNMLWMWWFGEVLANTRTPAQVLWIYILSGLGGALFFLLTAMVTTSGGSTLIGASAAVMGMMTVAAILSPDIEFRLFLIGNVKLKWLALVCVVLAFLGIGGGNAGGQSAHLGGVITGLCYALTVKYRHLLHRPRRKAHSFDTSRIKMVAKATPSDHRRLDELLDKIRLSGFDSLTKREQNELRFLSRKLGK